MIVALRKQSTRLSSVDESAQLHGRVPFEYVESTRAMIGEAKTTHEHLPNADVLNHTIVLSRQLHKK